MLDTIRNHIISNIEVLSKNTDDKFGQIFELITNKQSDPLKDFLVYVDNLLNHAIKGAEDRMSYLHIHFEGVNDDHINLLSEYILLKLFFIGLENCQNDKIRLIDEIVRIKEELRQTIVVPNAPYKNEGLLSNSREFKKFLEERRLLAKEQKFYKKLAKENPNRSIGYNTLINLLKKEEERLQTIFYGKNIFIPIDRIGDKQSNIVSNVSLSRDDLDRDSELLDNIENIVLINCDHKRLHYQFNYSDLCSWFESDRNYKNLFIFTFCKANHRFNRILSRLERITRRFYKIPDTKFPNLPTYTVIPSEVELLTSKKIPIMTDVDFHGEERSTILLELKSILSNYEDLYELISITMLGVYSVIINDRLKQFVLNNIFDGDIDDCLLSTSAKGIIDSDISVKGKQRIRNALELLLNSIIESNWSEILVKYIKEFDYIIIPGKLIKCEKFIDELINALGIDTRKHFLTWFDLDSAAENDILVLDYRDSGQFPHELYPNIFDLSSRSKNNRTQAIYLAMFFKNRFEWANYNLENDYYKLLNHNLRGEVYKWNELLPRIKDNRPQSKEYTEWNLERAYEYHGEVQSIKIEYWNGNTKLHHHSELFIVSYEDDDHLGVSQLEHLTEEFHNGQMMSIQSLDEIHSDFNIYDKITNRDREEADLNAIRRTYNIDMEVHAERIWKTLLCRYAAELGEEILYERLEALLSQNILFMVSFSTFKNSWLSIESDSLIPRGRMVFAKLCEFLDLPRSYFIIMLRIKNMVIQNTRSSNRHMNELLVELIEDGCFIEGSGVRQIIESNKQKYTTKFDLEEVGIPSEYACKELSSLVELLKPKIAIQKVNQIQPN